MSFFFPQLVIIKKSRAWKFNHSEIRTRKSWPEKYRFNYISPPFMLKATLIYTMMCKNSWNRCLNHVSSCLRNKMWYRFHNSSEHIWLLSDVDTKSFYIFMISVGEEFWLGGQLSSESANAPDFSDGLVRHWIYSLFWHHLTFIWYYNGS